MPKKGAWGKGDLVCPWGFRRGEGRGTDMREGGKKNKKKNLTKMEDRGD